MLASLSAFDPSTDNSDHGFEFLQGLTVLCHTLSLSRTIYATKTLPVVANHSLYPMRDYLSSVLALYSSIGSHKASEDRRARVHVARKAIILQNAGDIHAYAVRRCSVRHLSRAMRSVVMLLFLQSAR